MNLQAVQVLLILFYLVTAAIALSLSYIYFIGLRMARREGKDILRAVASTWLIISLLLVRRAVEEALLIDNIDLRNSLVWQGFSVLLFSALLILACYFLYATVKRSPPLGGEPKRR
jgi:membrane-associated HD superfamily phosphohydrolase